MHWCFLVDVILVLMLLSWCIWMIVTWSVDINVCLCHVFSCWWLCSSTCSYILLMCQYVFSSLALMAPPVFNIKWRPCKWISLRRTRDLFSILLGGNNSVFLKRSQDISSCCALTSPEYKDSIVAKKKERKLDLKKRRVYISSQKQSLLTIILTIVLRTIIISAALAVYM